jgi:hypothetical protein
MLNFSRNDAVDIEDANTLVSEQTNFAHGYQRHCGHAYLAALDYCQMDVQDQAIAATKRASEFRAQINDSSKDIQKRADTVRNRATREPHTGKCDAILVTSTPAFWIRDGNPDAAKFLDNFSFVLGTKSTTSKSQTKPETQSTVPPTPDSLMIPTIAATIRRPSPSPSGQGKTVDPLDPFYVCCTESRPAPALTNPDNSNASVINWTDLLLPAFVVENKKMDETKTKALNQGRMYSVSAVTFLASLGITGYPVYCLVTSGKMGGVLVTWHATKGKVRA